MPVARIVTRFPEHVWLACEFLREHGFHVEVVDPGDLRVTPAAFELKLDRCAPEQARARAERALRAYEAGSRPAEFFTEMQSEERVVVAYDITGRPVEYASEAEVRKERRTRPNSFSAALSSFFARTGSELRQAASQAVSSVRGAVQDRSAEREHHRLQQRAVAEPRAAERERQATEGAASERRAAEERQRRQAEDQTRRRQEAELEAGMAWVRERQARLAAEREAEERRQQQERQQQAREEAEARERERQAELARQSAQREAQLAAQREAEELERQAQIAREAEQGERERQTQLAAQREAEEQGRFEAERERARLMAERERAAAAIQAETRRGARQPNSEIAPWRRPGLPAPRLRREGEWKKAFIAAAAVALVAMLGIIGYATRRPASPLSFHELLRQNSIQQQAPFGPAATVPQPQPTAPAATNSAAPQVVKPAVLKPAQTSARQRPARRLRPSYGEAKEEDELLAKDEVVVRQFPRGRKQDRKVAASNEVKRYSDLD